MQSWSPEAAGRYGSAAPWTGASARRRVGATLGRRLPEPSRSSHQPGGRERSMRLSPPREPPREPPWGRADGSRVPPTVPSAVRDVEPVIATKLFVPALGTDAIDRPRLRGGL